jgi:hypothetical protein
LYFLSIIISTIIAIWLSNLVLTLCASWAYYYISTNIPILTHQTLPKIIDQIMSAFSLYQAGLPIFISEMVYLSTLGCFTLSVLVYGIYQCCKKLSQYTTFEYQRLSNEPSSKQSAPKHPESELSVISSFPHHSQRNDGYQSMNNAKEKRLVF